MAWYEIHRSCGHTSKINLVGRDRERRIEYYESQLCKECYQKEQEEKAAKINEENNLPTLKGSEKQINWANTIRAQKIQQYDDLVKDFDFRAQAAIDLGNVTAEKVVEEREKIIKARVLLLKPTNAAWWIENRELNVRELVRKLSTV